MDKFKNMEFDLIWFRSGDVPDANLITRAVKDGFTSFHNVLDTGYGDECILCVKGELAAQDVRDAYHYIQDAYMQ